MARLTSAIVDGLSLMMRERKILRGTVAILSRLTTHQRGIPSASVRVTSASRPRAG